MVPTSTDVLVVGAGPTGLATLTTRYPYTLMVSQATTEKVLHGELVRTRCLVL